jgi:hypothetical protein
MTAKEKRRLLQCLGGVFPCNAWLHRIKMVPSPDCPICGLTDHFSHRVLSCIAVSEAITAAHNKAWSTLYNLLVSHLPQSWEHWYDKVVSTIDIPCASHSHLKPDAILRHKLSNSIYILEFKRTNDFFLDSFRRGYLKKVVKYTPLIDALKSSNPDYHIELLIFCLGDRGLLDSSLWASNWETLSLPDNCLSPFCTIAALVAQQVASDILAVHSTAMKKLNAAPGPWPRATH